MTVAEALENAIEVKKRHGHAQGVFKDDDSGAICMFAAIAIGSGAADESTSPFLIARQCTPMMQSVAEALGFSYIDQVCAFNNTHTKEECIEQMEQSLAGLRNN